MRRSKATMSSSLNALSSDSIGTLWVTVPKARNGGAGDALRRGVRRDQVGILRLERAQLDHQLIVAGVRNLRLVQLVVALVVVRDLRAQLRDSSFGVLSHGPTVS